LSSDTYFTSFDISMIAGAENVFDMFAKVLRLPHTRTVVRECFKGDEASQ